MPRQHLSSPDVKAPLLLDGSPGAAGQAVTSRGPGLPPIWATPSGGGISDGDKGDIIVSDTGNTWRIDANFVDEFASTMLANSLSPNPF